MFIASLDTCAATELTIRSLRAHDQSEYDIVIGDGGSTDGSIEMLEQLHGQGWLRLEAALIGGDIMKWIEHRIATSAADYVVLATTWSSEGRTWFVISSRQRGEPDRRWWRPVLSGGARR